MPMSRQKGEALGSLLEPGRSPATHSLVFWTDTPGVQHGRLVSMVFAWVVGRCVEQTSQIPPRSHTQEGSTGHYANVPLSRPTDKTQPWPRHHPCPHHHRA